MSRELDILVVDDNSVDRMGISHRLKQTGFTYKLHNTGNPFEGIEMVKSIKPDCIFLDYHMPEMQAPTFIQNITDHIDKSVKIIVMTNMPREFVDRSLSNVSIDGVLSKESLSSPTAMKELLQFLFGA